MSAGRLSPVDHGVTYPEGFRASGIAAGIKRSHRPDLALLVSEAPAAAAGLFTTNRVRAAPVVLTEELLRGNPTGAHGVVIVSGVANALTGPEGFQDSQEVIRLAENAVGLPPRSMLHAATGMIGPRIPMEAIRGHIGEASTELTPDRAGASRAAAAILTTDTTTKEAAVLVRLADGTKVKVGGMAKGSGMIAPSLGPPHATTLAFLTTDAVVSPQALRQSLWQEADRTFNMLSVDGDTSTNDTILVLANGKAGGAPADEDPAFHAAIAYVLEKLARSVARDGEGATKLLTVNVSGAQNLEEARSAAKAVARSTLVKTALFGADPNVGRIACAVGYSGANFEPSNLGVSVAARGREWPLIEGGTPIAGLDNGVGHKMHALLQQLDEVVLNVRLGPGTAVATAWGCDLSYNYVHINARYRT